MAMTMHVDVVSAHGAMYSGVAEFMVVPGEMGDLGIYPRHAPLLTKIRPGILRIKESLKSEETQIFVAGGVLEIQPHTVTVLADTAVRAADLDESQALAAKAAAEKALNDRTANHEFAKVEIELAIAIAQLKAIEQLRKQRH